MKRNTKSKTLLIIGLAIIAIGAIQKPIIENEYSDCVDGFSFITESCPLTIEEYKKTIALSITTMFTMALVGVFTAIYGCTRTE